MTGLCLDRIGLILNLLSGILLVPEILDRLPIGQIQAAIDGSLESLEGWLRFPLRFHPIAWRLLLSERQRERLEAPMAIFNLGFSIIWMGTLLTGVLLASKFFVALGLAILVGVALMNWRSRILSRPQLGLLRIFGFFFVTILVIATLAPLLSLVRVLIIPLRKPMRRLRENFLAHPIQRQSLLAIAIFAFVLGNVFQYIATFY